MCEALLLKVICNKTGLPCKPSREAQLTSDTSDELYIVGVNHRMTNHSLYSSLTAYNYPKLASGILSSEHHSAVLTSMLLCQGGL